MRLKNLDNNTRKKILIIFLAVLAIVGVVFSAYRYQAQQQELQKVKKQSEELSKRLDKIIEVSPIPSATPTTKPTPTPPITHKAVRPTDDLSIIFPTIITNQPTNNTWTQDRKILEQKKNMENICKNTGGKIIFDNCVY